MAPFPLGFREVIPNQTQADKWREFTINIGGSQSTLQGIKLPENAGGWCYKNTEALHTRNRFIYWRVTNDVLELSEHSLDYNLNGNQVRYRFQDAPILGGVEIFETSSRLVVLVPTVCSVHRLLFTHPDKLPNNDSAVLHMAETVLQSVFAEATVNIARDPSHFYILNHSVASVPPPHAATCALISDSEALFALAYEDGLIQVVTIGTVPAKAESKFMKKSSIASVLGGWMPTVFRGNSGHVPETAVSMVAHANGTDVLLITLCRNNKLCLWSCQLGECLMTVDAIQNADSRQIYEGAHHHLLRKSTTEEDDELLLSTFVTVANHSLFSVFKLATVAGQYEMRHCTNIFSQECDLVDFVLTSSHLWALWTTTSSQPHLNYISWNGDERQETRWQSVILAEPPSRDPACVNPVLDPRQFFLKCIFKPGCFSVQTIAKALSIYRRTGSSSVMSNVSLSPSALKSSVCAAVDAEIQQEVSNYELAADEYVAMSSKCWARFYARCVEYCQTGMKPMGLFVDLESGMPGLVRKVTVSLLRPVEPLEYMWLTGTAECAANDIKAAMLACTDPLMAEDVLLLMTALQLIVREMPLEAEETFRLQLFHLENPAEICKEIARSLAETDAENQVSDGNFLVSLNTLLSNMTDFGSAVRILIRTLGFDMSDDQEMFLMDGGVPDPKSFLPLSRLYSSNFGITMVSESLQQMMNARLCICQYLLILQQLVVERAMLPEETLHVMKSECIPQTVFQTSAYFVMLWLTEENCSAVHTNTMEAGIRQLSVLNLNETADVQRASYRDFSPNTLAELFLHREGGSKTRGLLSVENEHDGRWQTTFLEYLSTIGDLTWAISYNTVFLEFLAISCQYMQIQQYVRLLEPWCEWNNVARQFFLGSAYLNLGEPAKAYEYFVAAGKGVTNDAFIAKKVVGIIDHSSCPYVRYFLKVIQLFEEFDYPQHVIELAMSAIQVGDSDDTDIGTLWSIAFKNHLSLGQHVDAYEAMLNNPDVARRRDCLREFVVVMFQRKELKALVSYPFANMYEEVEAIFESRARSADLMNHNYYDFLYAFHIIRGNKRKAATVMYEQAMRLSVEVAGLPSLQKQAKSYLACMNALQLVDEKYQWIVKPIPTGDNRFLNGNRPNASPKRGFDGEEIPPPITERKVEVLDVKDLKKEYSLLHTRLRLIQVNPDPGLKSGAPLSAEETISLLVNSSLYDLAINVSELFGLSLQPVMDGLATRCVYMELAETVDEMKICNWLALNDISVLGVTDATPMEQAWSLLEYYLSVLEAPRQTKLHKGISAKILSKGLYLPKWLAISYKKRNPAELLCLYLNNGMLEDATSLALGYIDAVLGIGNCDEFGLKTVLHINASPVWLPYTSLDLLLLELRDVQVDPEGKYSVLHSKLKSKLENYIKTVHQVSRDMMVLAQ